MALTETAILVQNDRRLSLESSLAIIAQHAHHAGVYYASNAGAIALRRLWLPPETVVPEGMLTDGVYKSDGHEAVVDTLDEEATREIAALFIARIAILNPYELTGIEFTLRQQYKLADAEQRDTAALEAHIAASAAAVLIEGGYPRALADVAYTYQYELSHTPWPTDASQAT